LFSFPAVLLALSRSHRHCERSEAIYPSTDAHLDCFASGLQ
jgi:hypothetical protein